MLNSTAGWVNSCLQSIEKENLPTRQFTKRLHTCLNGNEINKIVINCYPHEENHGYHPVVLNTLQVSLISAAWLRDPIVGCWTCDQGPPEHIPLWSPSKVWYCPNNFHDMSEHLQDRFRLTSLYLFPTLGFVRKTGCVQPPSQNLCLYYPWPTASFPDVTRTNPMDPNHTVRPWAVSKGIL